MFKMILTWVARFAARSIECPQCGGEGGVEHSFTVPDCCGLSSELGYCRGDCAVPLEVQEWEPCDACSGTGNGA